MNHHTRRRQVSYHTIRTIGEPGGRRPGGRGILDKIKDLLTRAWVALFGLAYRLRSLGGLRLAILGAAVFLAVAVPVTVLSVLNAQSGGSAAGLRAASNADPQSAAMSSPPSGQVAAFSPSPAPTPSPSPTPVPTPEPHPTNMVFGNGMEAPVVAEIQARLMELHYMENDEPTQYYGNITEYSVRLFQRQHELDVDGRVGKETWDLLMSDKATKYTVMLGADGSDVRQLQERLRNLGYMDQVTGHFGETTEAAVKRFQEMNGLGVDGKVGTVTREALYSPDSKPNMLRFGEDSPEIKQYQTRLKELGYLTTTPDGNYGNDTKAAVRRFQEINGLIPDGYLGYNTIQKLKSTSAKPNGIKLGMKGDDVTNVQKLLQKLGYTSAVTGYYGEITENAVKAFQKNNGLGTDGTVGKVTMAKLTSSSAKKATGGTSGGSSSGGSSGGSSSSSSSGVDKLISVAQSKLGSPYVFAAKGPNSFDCSGFVYYCLNQSGVSVGYMTSASWQTTSRFQRITSMSDLKRGDILSFQGHVGIYLGNGNMIDASSSRGVVRTTSGISSSSYWTSNFVCGYRVF